MNFGEACSKLLSAKITTTDWRVLFGLLVFFVILAGIGAARRVWSGDELEIGKWVKLRPNAQIKELTEAVEALSRDDKLKKRVLWQLRDHMASASSIVESGFSEQQVRQWAQGVVVDITAALSRGGEDRHRAALWYVDVENGPFRMYAAHGFRAEAVANARLDRKSIVGRVYQTGEAEVIADVETDAMYQPKARTGPPYHSLLLLPIRNGNRETIAVLCVDALAVGYFDDDDKFLGSCLGDLMGILVSKVLGRRP